MNILIVTLFTLVINLFLGRWRSRFQKFTWPWWLIIHASIPFIIPLRIYLNTPTAFIPLFIATAIIGQLLGAKHLPKYCPFKEK